MTTAQVLAAIREERQRQNAKWGDQRHHPAMWMVILQEELGEVAENLLAEAPLDEIETELVQAAAVIVAWIEDCTRDYESDAS